MSERENHACPKCGGANTKMFVDVTYLIPTKFEGNLTKKNLYSKETESWGAGWEFSTWMCSDCRWNSCGKGNFIKETKKVIDEIGVKYEKFESGQEVDISEIFKRYAEFREAWPRH